MKNVCGLTYGFELQQFIDLGEDDSDDGSDVDEGDDGDHDEFADGLLEPGHAALAGDAGAERGDRDGKGNDQDLKMEVCPSIKVNQEVGVSNIQP